MLTSILEPIKYIFNILCKQFKLKINNLKKKFQRSTSNPAPPSFTEISGSTITGLPATSELSSQIINPIFLNNTPLLTPGNIKLQESQSEISPTIELTKLQHLHNLLERPCFPQIKIENPRPTTSITQRSPSTEPTTSTNQSSSIFFNELITPKQQRSQNGTLLLSKINSTAYEQLFKVLLQQLLPKNLEDVSMVELTKNLITKLQIILTTQTPDEHYKLVLQEISELFSPQNSILNQDAKFMLFHIIQKKITEEQNTETTSGKEWMYVGNGRLGFELATITNSSYTKFYSSIVQTENYFDRLNTQPNQRPDYQKLLKALSPKQPNIDGTANLPGQIRPSLTPPKYHFKNF